MNEIEELKLEIIRLNLIIAELKKKPIKKRELNRNDVLSFIKSIGTIDKSSLIRKFQYVNACTVDKALNDLLGCGLITIRKTSGIGRSKTTYTTT